MRTFRRRCSGWHATYVAGSLIILFVFANPVAGGIISDRSAFVGDFTVIDFETRADGTPLILDEGEIFFMHPQEYAATGVTITSSGDFVGNEFPFIINSRGAMFETAQERVGSPLNRIDGGARNSSLRFDFSVPINAIGMAAWTRSDGLPVTLQVFDTLGALIEIVSFDGDLIDGILLGSDFSTEFDVSYGFLGYFSPGRAIGYAIVSDDLAGFDDLHFGVIPEPSTSCLLCCALLLIVLRRKKHHAFLRRVRAIPFLLAILSAPIALRAETINGTVTAFVMKTEDPICGDDGPFWCVQEPLQQVLLHGVRVCKSEFSCTFTDAQGDYQLTVNDPVSVNIEADLDGQWTKVGALVDIGEGVLAVVPFPPLVVDFDPANPPLNNRIDFVFNANPNPVSEIPTVEANIFYHTMLVREFYLQRHPSFTGLNVQIASARNITPCSPARFFPTLLQMWFTESGDPFPGQPRCIAKADRSIVAHEMGHAIHNALPLQSFEPTLPFREGFADTVALLVYDFPDLFIGQNGLDQNGMVTKKSYDFAADPSLRKINPCSDSLEQCGTPGGGFDLSCCGSILAGAWWDIKLNMQAKYGAAGAPDCPINPALNRTPACGLEMARQMFVDWSRVSRAPDEFPLVLLEILDLDDDDADLWNGSPHFTEICTAFKDHGMVCPFDCKGEGKHNLRYIAEGDADINENQIPDGCESQPVHQIIYVDESAIGADDGSSWCDAYKSLEEAILLAQGDGEIWVAAGKYRPSSSGDTGKSFLVADGMRMYGGFKGGELRLTQRDPVANETILSGDLNGADCHACSIDSPDCDAQWGGLCVDGCCIVPDNGENSLTVVTSALISSAGTLLDGFTITAGNGVGGVPGGMSISGRPTVRNCRFVGNFGGGDGGAVRFLGPESKPLFQNCRFENNRVPDPSNSGGAVSFSQDSGPRFVDCWFIENSAGNEGGAVHSVDSSPTFIRCNFEGNSALHGGGLLIRRPDSRGRGSSLNDCVFRDNSAVGSLGDGGGLNVDNTSTTLSGCLFLGNNAGRFGGGMYNEFPPRQTITDCIFGGNTAVQRGGAIYNLLGEMDVVNTLIVGNEATNGNGGGVYAVFASGKHDTFVNCTISHNRGGAFNSLGDGMYVSGSDPVELQNCILWANYGLDEFRFLDDQLWDDSGDPDVTTTTIEGSGDALDDDPDFRDPVGGDFRLSDLSPAKDKGTDSLLPAGIVTDLDGGPRIAGPINGPEIVDLGPYEWSDCDGNDTDDGAEIFAGTTPDCNDNGLPDGCDITNNPTGDCNGNDIPDECEECNGNGIADSCDIASGFSADVIGSGGGGGNGIPDECDQDCNENLIVDEFDLAGNDCNNNGIPDQCDQDCDGNGIPDECPFPPLPAPMECTSDLDCSLDPEPEGQGATCNSDGACECPSGLDDACLDDAACISDLCYAPRNKYISFQPNMTPGAATATAFRVKLAASTNLPGCVDKIRWVGEPAGDKSALLQSQAWYSDNWVDVVHIGDLLIVPNSTYEIVAVFQGSGDSSQLVEFPTSAEPADNKHWGDAVGAYNGTRWSPPNGVTNYDDTSAALKTFQDPDGINATHFSMTDILGHGYVNPSVPNRVVNIDDVFRFILAFKGEEYPCRQIGTCDLFETCDLTWDPPLPGPPSTLSLVLSSALISPNDLVDVDVFLDAAGSPGAYHLGAYQLALEVTGGDAGTLDLESRSIDALRTDYVFYDMNTIKVADDVGEHIAGLDADGVGVAVGGPVYLGAFQFRASFDADGVFHIGFQGIQETFLATRDGDRIANVITGAGVDIAIGCAVDADCDDGLACSTDTCVNGVCEHADTGGCAVSPTAASAPDDTPKNRYVSFVPNNTVPVAFQLLMTDSTHFPASNGLLRWVDAPELVDGNYVSFVTNTPVFRTWSESVVHVGDCRVVPAAGYELRATFDGQVLTAPLVVSTIDEPADGRSWGDVVSSFINNVWGPPQGVTNFDDVVAAIQGFQVLSTAPPLTWVDVEPEDINHVVNFADVQRISLAFQGEAYPFSAPAACPGVRSGPPVIGDPATFTLVASDPFIDPGVGVEIEVFIDSLLDLGGYQVTLEVGGGTSGTLVLTGVTVDDTHPDYVFNGQSAVPSPDVPRARVGNALTGAQSGVPVSGPGYLATFSYIPSESAYGDFHVDVVVGQDDTLPMDSTATRLAYNGGSCTVIGVGFDCHVDADCDDGNDCTIDTCVNNACTFSNAASGTACDDGLFCTTTSECDGSGTCVGSGSPCPPQAPVCCELTDTCVAVGVFCTAPI